MEREKQLKFCKLCENQKLDFERGFVCALTNDYPDFEDTCPNYIENPRLVNRDRSRTYEYKLSNEPNYFDDDDEVGTIYYELASKGTRFLNYIIDYAIIMIVLITLMVLYFVSVGPNGYDFENESDLKFYVFTYAIYFIYYFLFEYFTGRTIGKLLTKTKVVTIEGEKPDVGTTIGRTFCRFIPFEAFSFFGSESDGWHDKFSKTMVVKM